MVGTFETLKVIALMAVRNLFASRLKTIIVGGIILFGAFLVVLGTSLVDSIDAAMSRSITGSVAGQIQVYSSKSKDPLEIMGGFDLEGGSLAPLDDFAVVKQTLLSVPNVATVVPMGISGAIVTSGNTIDLALADLRDVIRKRQAGDASAETEARYEEQKDHVRQMVKVLEGDIENMAKLQDESALSPDDVAAVKRAVAAELWNDFDRDPLNTLEFLENRIAPLATDADMLFLRYVGTDPDVFKKSFDRMKIIEGTTIPRGQRGFLFARYTYEEQLKLKTARRFDKIKEAIENRGAKIASDLELQRFVRENVGQVREIQLQLNRPKTELFRQKLKAELGKPADADIDVAKLLVEFFQTTDGNFSRRYDFFYRELAPHLQLYRVRVGDTFTIKAFTKSGYLQSINLRVYGVFTYEGLEKSPQAGQLNLMDMVSFRELYGFLTEDKRKEIEALKGAVAAKEVSRDNAEAELFGTKQEDSSAATPAGGARTVEADATPGLKLAELGGLAGRLAREDLASRVYDPKQLQSGVVLNAAVILKDPRALEKTITDIEAAGRAAGLPLKAISWQKASGLVGQFIVLARIILYTAVFIIFLVALVIINNALVMATLERVREIGTLRAVGAQRRFILTMLVIEALVVGVVFGAVGLLLGGAAVGLLHRVGIPAVSEVLQFFFSGPKLYPAMGTTSLVIALFSVLFVSVVSSFYPAFLAMRVTPRQAMQTEE